MRSPATAMLRLAPVLIIWILDAGVGRVAPARGRCADRARAGSPCAVARAPGANAIAPSAKRTATICGSRRRAPLDRATPCRADRVDDEWRPAPRVSPWRDARRYASCQGRRCTRDGVRHAGVGASQVGLEGDRWRSATRWLRTAAPASPAAAADVAWLYFGALDGVGETSFLDVNGTAGSATNSGLLRLVGFGPGARSPFSSASSSRCHARRVRILSTSSSSAKSGAPSSRLSFA